MEEAGREKGKREVGRETGRNEGRREQKEKVVSFYENSKRFACMLSCNCINS